MLSTSLTVTEAMKKLDKACKKLLSFKIILAHILHTCVEEFRDIPPEDIAEKYIIGTPEISRVAVHRDEGTESKDKTVNQSDDSAGDERIEGTNTEDSSVSEGTVTFDIRFEVLNPRKLEERAVIIVNIEGQQDFHPGYPITKRGVYYGSRLISAQYGTKFSKSHYEKIQPCYSIWINLNPPDYRQNTLNLYSFHETQLVGDFAEKKENYDLITVAMVCLGDVKDEKCKGLIRMLSILLSREMKAADKKQKLSSEFHIPMTTEMEKEERQMCNYGMWILKKGVQQGNEESARRMLEDGELSLDKIAKYSDLTLEQVLELKKELQPV